MPGPVVVITWTNHNVNTIWNQLAQKLGRQPTDAEAADEVRRILAEQITEGRQRGGDSKSNR